MCIRDSLTADISVYERNCALLTDALREMGYHVVQPGGAFYLFPRSLEPDDMAFSERAKKFDLLLVPGSGFGAPGPVSYTHLDVYKRQALTGGGAVQMRLEPADGVRGGDYTVGVSDGSGAVRAQGFSGNFYWATASDSNPSGSSITLQSPDGRCTITALSLIHI